MNESEFVLERDELRNIKIKKTHEQPFKKAPVTSRQGLCNISGIYMLKWRMIHKSAVPIVNWNTWDMLDEMF